MSIAEAFAQYGKTQPIPTYVYWMIAGIFILGAGLLLLRVYARKKLAQLNLMTRFQNFAKETNIEGQLFDLLLHIVQTQQMPDPIQILKNVNTYDTITSAYLKATLEKGLKAGDYENILIQVTKMRSLIAAKNKESFKPIESTLDLYSGLDVQVEVKAGPHAGVYETTVASASANNLVIHSPTINQRKLFLDPETPVLITFTREADAVYQFETTVIGKYRGSLSAIMLNNTKNINVSHVRKYDRVSPNFLIKILGTAAPNNNIHKIEALQSEPVYIIDISGGGIQIQVNQQSKLITYLTKGNILVFSIYIPEIGPIEELKGRILRTDAINDRNYVICSMEYHNMTAKNRCRLLQGILIFLSKHNP